MWTGKQYLTDQHRHKLPTGFSSARTTGLIYDIDRKSSPCESAAAADLRRRLTNAEAVTAAALLPLAAWLVSLSNTDGLLAWLGAATSLMAVSNNLMGCLTLDLQNSSRQ